MAANISGGVASKASVMFRWIAVIEILALVACAAQTLEPGTDDAAASERIEEASSSMRVAVLPVKNIAAIYGQNASVRSPITGKVFITGPVMEDAPVLLADLILDHLRESTAYEVLPPSRIRGVYEQVLSGVPAPSSDREAVTWMGRRLGADAVIVGHIFRFRERQGSRLAAETPASVAFYVQMVLSDSGRILWNGSADETQAPLSDNLFQIGKFIQRQGRWITAREMANAALSRIFESLP